MPNNFECEPLVVEEIPGYFKVYSDGSVVREDEPSFLSAISERDDVLYKDVVFDEEAELWARLYLPPLMKTNSNSRVPVLLYFHGSGFILSSPASPHVHSMCKLWAAKLGVIIISVKYRLAPEHRLPAAYQDSIVALRWLEAMKKDDAVADPWLQSHADLSKIFVIGDSAGGNIAHHLGVWAAKASGEAENAMEIKIKGMILLYPFFGCEDRMPSQEGSLSILKVEHSDAYWRLALPLGSNRDHPFCNPVGEGTEDSISKLSLPPILFVVPGRDTTRDKQLQYCEFLKNSGKEVEVLLFDDEDHGFNYLDVEGKSAVELHRRTSDFMK
ncbi:hypothetical protein KI387_033175 [Taxus chinensis]|uniref:Alpha/beta hydrolase fold-3 domain-containing protein n=1 Tax=Taxus chinensis TaxID=29808 RepID=A0AA38F466_TAXCH|nr:hypothetical protein KI387_033175 [Taxus chinensis]